MKIFYKFTSIISILLLLSAAKQTQAQVLIGDIAFTGYNSVGAITDEFSFIILKTGGLPASTVINFTNCGWGGNLAAACNSNNLFPPNLPAFTESDISWTSPASLLTYGTQVRITGLTATAGTVTGTFLDQSGLGDQIFAFTGARTAPTFIAGIQMNVDLSANGNTWDNIPATPTSATASNRPACLTDGTYSVWLGITETDNAVFKCGISISPTKAIALGRINNAANWDKQDGTAFVLPQACIVVVPVILVNFQAKNNFSNIFVEWKVTSQQNLEKYELERSFDGSNFEKIATVLAKISSGDLKYNYTDLESLKNSATIIYYRLKSIDQDGKFSFSDIVTVRNKKDIAILVDNFANPINDKINFNLTVKTAGLVTIQLTDVNGKIAISKQMQISSGISSISLPEAGSLSKGIYFLRVTTTAASMVTKLIK